MVLESSKPVILQPFKPAVIKQPDMPDAIRFSDDDYEEVDEN